MGKAWGGMHDSGLDANTAQQIEQSVNLLLEVLPDDLLGMYLYGSAILGGLQRYSDIDMLAISTRSTTHDEKNRLEKGLLGISGIYRSTEKRPIEMTIVVQSEVNPWHYPPSFDFLYGDWLRKEFESGNVEPWPNKSRADLALLITQVRLASRTLYGRPPTELLPQVPYQDFMAAMFQQLDGLRADLESDTRNVLLTLARIWLTVATDLLGSKQKAAAWTIERLPEELKPIMHRALQIALGDREETWKDLQSSVSECADFIVGRIKEMPTEVSAADSCSKRISGLQ